MCANSSLPVLQSRNSNAPMSLLTHSLGGMNLTSGLNTTESDSPLNSSSNHSQPVTTDSTLMTLASLISMSPALASLALPFVGHSVNASNASTDFAAAAAAAISPGFLTALAQYLNVQPHATGHQSVSPMQQLAETAQLAAQLAAMVGAHSPDQTPMQPAQALALAQLVMSQAASSVGFHVVLLSITKALQMFVISFPVISDRIDVLVRLISFVNLLAHVSRTTGIF